MHTTYVSGSSHVNAISLNPMGQVTYLLLDCIALIKYSLWIPSAHKSTCLDMDAEQAMMPLCFQNVCHVMLTTSSANSTPSIHLARIQELGQIKVQECLAVLLLSPNHFGQNKFQTACLQGIHFNKEMRFSLTQ